MSSRVTAPLQQHPRSRRRFERWKPVAIRPSLLYSTLTLTYQRVGDVTRVIAKSSMTGVVFFVWYLDGAYVATTTAAHRDFQLLPGDNSRVDVLATTDPAFDPIVAAPIAFPSRRSLWWVRCTDVDVDYYLIEQKVGAGAYSSVARVAQVADAWTLGWLSARLTDLASYTWRVTPYDREGNAGTASIFGPQTIVRRPDAPNFTVSAAAALVTFTSAP